MKKPKSARRKLRDKLDREHLQGYRVGFDKGYADGRKYGRSELRTELSELLGFQLGKDGKP